MTSVNDSKESDIKAHRANSPVKVETESPVSNAYNEKQVL